MLLSFCYVLVVRLLGMVLLRGRSEVEKDAELVVLRHEIAILRRQAKRPVYRATDRAFLARPAGCCLGRSGGPSW